MAPRPNGPQSNRRQVLGARGEGLAADWYRRRGYQVLERNWRCRNGEIDLIVRRRGELVFCEVKTRTSRRFGHPVEAVTAAKQQRIRGLALQWISARGVRAKRLRFDVAAVEGREVQVWTGAF